MFQRSNRSAHLSLAIGAALLAAGNLCAPAQCRPAAAQRRSVDAFEAKFAANTEKIDAWYVYTGADNESHIKKIAFDGQHMPFFGAKNGLFKINLNLPKKDAVTYIGGQLARINIYSAPGSIDLPAHRSPGSEMFLILRGSSTFLGKDGTVQDFGPGDLVIFEDATGGGHSGKIGPDGFTAVNFEFQSPISALAKSK